MKTNIYKLIAGALIALQSTNATAQTWYPKHAGLPTYFNAGYIYGEGKGMMVTNAAPSSGGDQLYYTRDTTTPMAASGSSFGMYAAVMTGVQKCKGMYFVAGVGGVFSSTDNGHNWTLTGSGAVATSGLYAHNDTLFANFSLSAGAINYSTDAGATWTLMSTYPGGNTPKFLKHNGVLYAASLTTLYYTADNGTTWTPAPKGGPGSVTSMVVFQGDVYASCATGVYKTRDNGANWTQVTPIGLNCMTAVDTSIIGGSSITGAYQSDKSATIWASISTGLPPYVGTAYRTIRDITWNDEFVMLVSVSSDSAIYVTKLSDLGLKAPVTPPTAGIKNTSVTQMSINISPNPAQYETVVNISNAAAGAVTVQLSDMTGRIVKTMSSERTTNIHVDLNNIPQGVYMLQAAQGKTHIISKLEIVK